MAKSKAPPVTSEINVIPLADVMLVMLIIFMVITPMLSKGVSVDMVMTDNPVAMADADKEDAVLMAVTRDGKVLPGKHPNQRRRRVSESQGIARKLAGQDHLPEERCQSALRTRCGSCGQCPGSGRRQHRVAYREEENRPWRR